MIINWFYDTFSLKDDVTEEFSDPTGEPVRRDVQTYLSDPGWWGLVVALGLMGIACILMGGLPLVIGIYRYCSIEGWIFWPLYSWVTFGGTLAIGIISLLLLKRVLSVYTIWVRQDQKCDRQMFGSNRYFRNCPILNIPGWTQLAFFSGNQQKVQSGKTQKSDFALTSFIMQGKSPRTKPLSKMSEDEKHQFLLDSRDVDRHEQFVVLEIVYYLGIWTLPRLLSEKFFSAFHKRWKDPNYNAMEDAVQKKVLEIVVGAADGVLQDFSMEELNSDVKEANEELTKQLLPALRRIGVELEQVIIVKVDDMDGIRGYQKTKQAAIEARQKSDQEQSEAESDRLSREKRAIENQTASEKEQEARAKIAEAEAEALKQVILAERQRQRLANQAIIERMKAVANKPAALALTKLQEMSPEQISEIIKTGLANINPNLQGTTLASVEGLGEFLKNLPATRLLEWIVSFIEGKETLPPSPPTS